MMPLLFNMLSGFVIAFFPSSKCLLISWLKSPTAVIVEPKKIKSATVSTFSTSICCEVIRLDAMILHFLNIEFQANFSLSSFTLIKRLFNSSLLSAVSCINCTSKVVDVFLLEIFITANIYPYPNLYFKF